MLAPEAAGRSVVVEFTRFTGLGAKPIALKPNPVEHESMFHGRRKTSEGYSAEPQPRLRISRKILPQLHLWRIEQVFASPQMLLPLGDTPVSPHETTTAKHKPKSERGIGTKLEARQARSRKPKSR
jgi:hypothetical protein